MVDRHGVIRACESETLENAIINAAKSESDYRSGGASSSEIQVVLTIQIVERGLASIENYRCPERMSV